LPRMQIRGFLLLESRGVPRASFLLPNFCVKTV
jgi:hypothetical protein